MSLCIFLSFLDGSVCKTVSKLIFAFLHTQTHCYEPVAPPYPVWAYYVHGRQQRCQEDPVSLPSGKLENTTRSSPHHVAQHRPTGSETTPPYAARSSRFGLEPPSVEDDVDVWGYAILELHARNDDDAHPYLQAVSNKQSTWPSEGEVSAGLSSVRLLSVVDDVTDGVTSDADVVTGCVRTSFVGLTRTDAVTFDPVTCDPVLLAATDCFELALDDSSAFSFSILAASFFTVCRQTIHTHAFCKRSSEVH